MRDMESHSLDISCLQARLSVEELDSIQWSFGPSGVPQKSSNNPGWCKDKSCSLQNNSGAPLLRTTAIQIMAEFYFFKTKVFFIFCFFSEHTPTFLLSQCVKHYVDWEESRHSSLFLFISVLSDHVTWLLAACLLSISPLSTVYYPPEYISQFIKYINFSKLMQ